MVSNAKNEKSRKTVSMVSNLIIFSFMINFFCGPCHAFSPNRMLIQERQHKSSSCVCLNESNNKRKGVYSRPSAAIERGSGFFIPGLEGGRVRVAFGILLGIANQFLAASTTSNSEYYSTSITITNIFVTILLIQAGVEYIKDTSPFLLEERENSSQKRRSSSNSSTKNKEVDQYIAPVLLDSSKDQVESISWVASTLLALTSATGISLISSGKEAEGKDKPILLYQLSGSENNNESAKEIMMSEFIMKKYLKIISQSSSGRVSVPPEEGDTSIKTIILQRINNDMCLVLTSNQLLASFTKNDLKWLRKMADYIKLEPW